MGVEVRCGLCPYWKESQGSCRFDDQENAQGRTKRVKQWDSYYRRRLDPSSSRVPPSPSQPLHVLNLLLRRTKLSHSRSLSCIPSCPLLGASFGRTSRMRRHQMLSYVWFFAFGSCFLGRGSEIRSQLASLNAAPLVVSRTQISVRDYLS